MKKILHFSILKMLIGLIYSSLTAFPEMEIFLNLFICASYMYSEISDIVSFSLLQNKRIQ